MALTIVRLEIRGQVQGVGYRWSMVEQAARLCITGWVRNRRDGSVEAMVAGETDAVEQMIEWARRGPASAFVSTVDIHPGEGTFEGFEQRSTA